MNRKFKLKLNFCVNVNVINVLVTFDQFNVSLLNQSFNFFKRKKIIYTHYWPQTFECCLLYSFLAYFIYPSALNMIQHHLDAHISFHLLLIKYTDAINSTDTAVSLH